MRYEVDFGNGAKNRYSAAEFAGLQGSGLFDGLAVTELPDPVTADDVRAEAQRRIIARTGATSLEASIVKQLNAQMRASELILKLAMGQTWTEAEAAEAAALQALADDIKAIRAASNVLEAMEPVPDNYTDDNWWGM